MGRSKRKNRKRLEILKNNLDANLLTLNLNKTNFMAFTCYKDTSHALQNITMHKINCSNECKDCPNKKTRVKKLKYLGIYIDQNLKWQKHIEMTCKKLRCVIYKLKRFILHSFS